MNASYGGSDEQLRLALDTLLSQGLETEWQQRAYTSAEVNARVLRLQAVARTDYRQKLTIAGFTPRPYLHPEDSELEQCCATCMYFVRHRGHCELPELDCPVRPDWSCVLWRI